MTTLHFENAEEDELRRVGMSKEHRVDPQVQVGLLVDPVGFPLEVHLFDFDQDIYGRYVYVNFLHKLRPELRFDSFEALKEQIHQDARDARSFFAAM